MRRPIIAGLAVALLSTTAAHGQARNPAPTASSDILALPVIPVPADGNIIVKFGETARVYFARAIKTMKLDDDLVVRLAPLTDHVVDLTGLSPGRRKIRMTSTDDMEFVAAEVIVVGEARPVRMFQGREINRITGERRSDSTSAIGGYVTLNCNEIKCVEQEPELKPVLPR